MVVTASQRHSLIRAKANAAAVTMARYVYNAQKSGFSEDTRTGVTNAAATPSPANAGPCSSAAASVPSATIPSRMNALAGARKSYNAYAA